MRPVIRVLLCQPAWMQAQLKDTESLSPAESLLLAGLNWLPGWLGQNYKRHWWPVNDLALVNTSTLVSVQSYR